jgi:hypothetical protein
MIQLKTIKIKDLSLTNDEINIDKIYHFLTNNYFNLDEHDTVINFDDFVFLLSFVFNDEEYNLLCVEHKGIYNHLITKTTCKEFIKKARLDKKQYEVFDVRYYDLGFHEETGDSVYRINKFYVNRNYIYQFYPIEVKEDDNLVHLTGMYVEPELFFVINEPFGSVANKLLD